MDEITKKDISYWNAFSGRMFAFGLGASIVRGLTVSGDAGDNYRALNEWLREKIPDLAEDEAAECYMRSIRESN